MTDALEGLTLTKVAEQAIATGEALSKKCDTMLDTMLELVKEAQAMCREAQATAQTAIDQRNKLAAVLADLWTSAGMDMRPSLDRLEEIRTAIEDIAGGGASGIRPYCPMCGEPKRLGCAKGCNHYE